ncbi:MAG TPA: amidohydrolase family protein [Verrucomicrobiae bacterium]|nr:amidohydrolase family protein [Verrucomicrobiae bacterium]
MRAILVHYMASGKSYNNRMEIFNINKNVDTIVYAGAIIDDSFVELRTNVLIRINNGWITEVHDNVVPEKVKGNNVIMLSGITLLPGFIDCHVHLALDGVDFQGSMSRWEREESWLPGIRLSLEDSWQSGLAAIRDGGDKAGIGLRARNLQRQGKLEGPRVVSSGQAICKQGYYGSFLGPGITNLVEGKQAIDRLHKQGVDLIKILVSGIVSFREYGKVGQLQFSQAELSALVSHAHSLGLSVMAHASSDAAVLLCINAGVDSIEHGYFVSEGSLEAMAQKDIAWVPTVVPVANQGKNTTHGPDSIDVITRTYELQLKRISLAGQLGIRLGIGTDAGAAGVRHGADYFRELLLFNRAGLEPGQIIKAASGEAARICGLDKEFGSIQEGKRACLLGFNGNPLADISLLESISCRIG